MSSKSEEIKELCVRIAGAQGAELERLVERLRKALQDHYDETRRLMRASYPAGHPEKPQGGGSRNPDSKGSGSDLPRPKPPKPGE